MTKFLPKDKETYSVESYILFNYQLYFRISAGWLSFRVQFKRFKITFIALNKFVKFAVHIYTLGSTS